MRPVLKRRVAYFFVMLLRVPREDFRIPKPFVRLVRLSVNDVVVRAAVESNNPSWNADGNMVLGPRYTIP